MICLDLSGTCNGPTGTGLPLSALLVWQGLDRPRWQFGTGVQKDDEDEVR